MSRAEAVGGTMRGHRVWAEGARRGWKGPSGGDRGRKGRRAGCVGMLCVRECTGHHLW